MTNLKRTQNTNPFTDNVITHHRLSIVFVNCPTFTKNNQFFLEEAMHDVEVLARKFRNAIDAAIREGDPVISKDACFSRFPIGCCGDACDLLGQFLLDHNIRTYYVCGTYRDGVFENTQSHAWLLTEEDVIIDITGDQFHTDSNFLCYNYRVYYGKEDDFHKLFDVGYFDIYEYKGLVEFDLFAQIRLVGLYRKICEYLEYPSFKE